MYIIRWQAFLLIAMLVPYVFTFVQSLFLSIFFIKHSPPFLLALWVGEDHDNHCVFNPLRPVLGAFRRSLSHRRSSRAGFPYSTGHGQRL